MLGREGRRQFDHDTAGRQLQVERVLGSSGLQSEGFDAASTSAIVGPGRESSAATTPVDGQAAGREQQATHVHQVDRPVSSDNGFR